MEYRKLGKSDLTVSSIGMGTSTFAREIDEATAFTVLDRAYERNITFYDTAEAYSAGQSEVVLGNWIKSRGVRQNIVLATKVTIPLGAERVLASADASLQRLQTDVIDLFQLHAFDANVPLEETLGALNQLVEAGKVRYIGCSNFAAWQLINALWISDRNKWAQFVSVQPVYNLALRDIESELLPACADQNIGVITYSPLGAGFLTGKYTRDGNVPAGTRFDVAPGHQPIYFNDPAYSAMERLRARSEEVNIPMPRLGLAWVLSRPNVTVTLVGGRTPKHIDQAFESLELAQSENFAELSAGL
jgi:aryl-alcohol dehydrogenase-like predicted oxidoreductase